MGKKEGELWDDSSLIKAFDSALSNYKKMHGVREPTTHHDDEGEKAAAADPEQTLQQEAVCVENNKNVDSAKETTAKIEDVVRLLQIKDNPASDLSPAENVDSFGIQNGNAPPANENHSAKSVAWGAHVVASDDVKFQAGTQWYSDSQDHYNQLLNEYYVLEDQRQKIIQQLNQYNNWNYQNPVSSTFSSENYNAPVSQPYESITCYCPYGCQNWTVPCNSFPASSSSCPSMCKSCNSTFKTAEDGKSKSQQDANIEKTAMVAAERALSSLTREAVNGANASSSGGKEEGFGVEMDQFVGATRRTTDLDVVLKAWYSAGFYTGKYLSEQSFAKGKHDQSL